MFDLLRTLLCSNIARSATAILIWDGMRTPKWASNPQIVQSRFKNHHMVHYGSCIRPPNTAEYFGAQKAASQDWPRPKATVRPSQTGEVAT